MWRYLMRLLRRDNRVDSQRAIEERDASLREARQARARSEQAKVDAEQRWHDVTRVTDDFATAMEKALRSMR